ncbi:hypothetical protein ACJX0J_035273, partial [Zea mays]
MNDADVSKQIQQMVRFIRQEADEKANEISVSAEEEFNIEKLQLVEAEKKKIRQEYERKEKQVEVRKKIEYSMQLNASRIKVLQAQDDLVNKMKDDAMKELLLVSHNHHEYKNLLKDLIIQGLLRLKEPAVLLRCRKDDHHHVESVLHSAKHEYASKADVHEPEIFVDHDVYLPPAPSHHDAHGQFCSGGIVLASRDGKIKTQPKNHSSLMSDVVLDFVDGANVAAFFSTSKSRNKYFAVPYHFSILTIYGGLSDLVNLRHVKNHSIILVIDKISPFVLTKEIKAIFIVYTVYNQKKVRTLAFTFFTFT